MILTGHTYSVRCLCELSDGRLISGSYDETVRLWDLHQQQPEDNGSESSRIVSQQESEVIAMCILMDGRICVGLSDRTLRILQ